MKKWLYAGFCLICALALLFAAPSASAASTDQAREPIDPQRPCALTLSYVYDGAAFPRERIDLYRVAAVSADYQYTPTGAFGDYPLTLNGLSAQSDWEKLASTLSAYIAADSIPASATQATDGAGQARFADLEPGLYFVEALRVQRNGEIYSFERLLIALPALQEDGTWLYEAEAAPKCSGYVPTEGEIEYRVNKLWSDGGAKSNRPTAVEIALTKDGKLAQTVSLSAENDWSYAWIAPDDGAVWQAAERNVPNGYTVTVTQKGATFVVTNTLPGAVPPKTGDGSGAALWLLLLAVSGGGVAALVIGYKRRAAR